MTYIERIQPTKCLFASWAYICLRFCGMKGLMSPGEAMSIRRLPWSENRVTNVLAVMLTSKSLLASRPFTNIRTLLRMGAKVTCWRL